MKYVIACIALFFTLPFFAQKMVSETLTIKNGKIILPGILSYPDSGKKLPLVIFVHGSGNIDRDGNQAGINVKANYIKSLADTLNRKYIAFFRYDKRTAVPENIKLLIKDMIYDYLVEDVKKVIAHFKNDIRFDKIILMGHSQGSLTAMLALNDAIDKYISLAGLGESMEKTIIRQISAQSKELSETARQHFEELRKTDTIREVHPFLMALFAAQNHKFIQSYNAYDPVEMMGKVNIPTLIINGDADSQVRIKDAKLLHKAKPDAKLIIIPKMNHLLKEVNSIEENQRSYYDENYPLSSVLVKEVTDFIKQ